MLGEEGPIITTLLQIFNGESSSDRILKIG